MDCYIDELYKSDSENEDFTKGAVTETLTSFNHLISLGEELNELRIHDIFCDFVIKTKDGDQLKAHKNVLAATCPYFKAMFDSGLSECTENVCSLSDISTDQMENLLLYMYTGRISVTEQNVKELFLHSHYLQLHEVLNFCENLLQRMVSSSTCADLRKFAERNLLSKLKEKCVSYFCKNPTFCFKEPSFLTLGVNELISFLSDGNIDCSQQSILKFILQWVKTNNVTELDFLKALLKVDLTEIPVLVGTSMMFEVLPKGNVEKYLAVIEKAFAVATLKSKDQELAITYEPKVKKHIIPIFEKSCSLASTMPSLSLSDNRYYYSHAVHKKNLVFISGGWDRDEGATTKACKYYSSLQEQWNDFPDLPSQVYHHRSMFCNDKLYVCGGRNSKAEYLNTVYISDLNKGLWTSGPPLKSSRSSPGLACVNGCLYMFGGRSVVTNEFLDPRTDSWQVLPPSYPFLNYTKVVPINNNIYCFDSTAAQMCVFDTKNQIFSEPKKLFDGYDEFCYDICTLGNNIYTIGCTAKNISCYKINLSSVSDFNTTKCFEKPLKDLKQPYTFALIALNIVSKE